MPKLDFDVITLGHGSGGTLTNKLLDSGVFDVLSNDILNERHDGAFLEMNGKMAFSTDSFLVSPIFFPGGNIGELAVNGTVNDLAMCGATPKYLSLSFIIEEGLKMTEFWEILVAIKNACEKADVKVVTGDTKVVEKGKGDKVFINTSGIGNIHPKAHISEKNIKIGDKIIVSGNIATHGMAIMSVREGLEFDSTIESDTINLNHTISRLIDGFGSAIHLLTDPTRGGVATVLKEIALSSNIGIDIFQKDLPIDSQVASACELLGLDPLYVANEGLFLSFVDASIANSFVETLQKDENGTNAKIIGTVVEAHPKQVILESAIGGKRMVSMLPGEQLPRIC
ncbi:MAG: hydrogenase expression/formation protein HypE [Muricauda sp.]|uniref:Hydrogenase expression/formation protein HypE n=2 Tax=Flagellimonas profundi TaxID=2915620 RepID=A0ABS3FCW3_9FLAO|nr:hydrogenase expression/formation protein HypE [Allomuricauda sp.]MBC30840.1 hydrogenase expression/formation protein HypE [Allomuricauda sp.]MBO0340555.1 hydrogenase expression/formation protein HypE [Allomuricauda profundi]